MTARSPAPSGSLDATLSSALVGGVVSALAYRVMSARADRSGRWWRTNFAGAPVSLFAGPAVVTGAVVGAFAAGRPRQAAVTGIVGAVGLYDDLVGTTGRRGLRGHLAGLRSGEVTSGAVKVGVIGLTALAAAAAAPRADVRTARGILDVGIDAAVVAGTANLLNLLDLRPGRAVKAAAVIGTPSVLAAAPVGGILGAVGAIASHDLAGETMLGDCGANAAGAALAMGFVEVAPRPVRIAWLAAVTALTLASERVSFSAVIDRVPWLRRLDQAGRRSPPA